MHVPADANEETIPRGVELALALIRSIAESELAAKEDPGDREAVEADQNMNE